VVVTHELASIDRIADRALMLSAGKALADGTLDELRRSDNAEMRAFFQRIAAGEVRKGAASALEALRGVSR
jgi:ABC-type transporter Mla maintaining outer membrane lipid asymmetry ATPase subunit MlaF